MKQCRLRFDEDFESCDWEIIDAEAEPKMRSGTVAVDDLASCCEGVNRVTCFIPQQHILMTSAQLPPRAGKQQLNAIAFAVEDQLADDIENCFFATAVQQPDGQVPVAVINRALMDQCIEILSQNHIRAMQILPEIYLCPWLDDEAVLCTLTPRGEGLLVRSATHAGLYCNRSILQPILQILIRDKSASQQQIHTYGDVDLQDAVPDGIEVIQHDAAKSVDTFEHGAINLRQKEYTLSNQWFGAIKKWRWPVTAAALLLLVLLTNGVLEYWNQTRRYDALIQQQQQLLQQYLPELPLSDDPKTQLAKVLADSGSGSNSASLIDFLHEYVKIKDRFKTLQTSRILFQDQQLVVSLETRELKSLEDFKLAMEKSRFNSKIENLNINPENTTGRLIVSE